MDIMRATLLAMEKGLGIRNSACKKEKNYLLPTNTNEGFFIIPEGYSFTDMECPPGVRWCPHAADVITEDWELYPKK